MGFLCRHRGQTIAAVQAWSSGFWVPGIATSIARAGRIARDPL
jgi:hypothetical protein